MSTTSSIGSASRNFVDPASWWAGFAPGGWIGQCYNDSLFSISTTINLGGMATSATDFGLLGTGPGQSFRDNANRLTNALKFNQANGAALIKTSNYTFTLQIGNDFVTLEFLQISGGADSSAIAASSGALHDCLVDSCILVGNFGGNPVAGVPGATNSVIRNCLLIQNNATGLGLRGTSGLTAQFCTIVAPSNISNSGKGITQNYSGTYSLTNCSIFGFSTFGDTTFSYTGDNNATDLASGAPGAHTLFNLTYANQFVGTTSSAEDFREKAGASTIGAGTAIGGITTDIVGTARTNPPDIGAWQNSGAAPSLPPSRSLMGVGQ